MNRCAGFSYVEVLVATLLIAVALVPALDALYSGVQGGAVHADQARDRLRLTARLEGVLAQPFILLSKEADAAGGAGSAVALFSDAAGTAARRLVYLTRYDGDDADGDSDPFTGVDEGLLWVRVEIENTHQALETLIGR